MKRKRSMRRAVLRTLVPLALVGLPSVTLATTIDEVLNFMGLPTFDFDAPPPAAQVVTHIDNLLVDDIFYDVDFYRSSEGIVRIGTDRLSLADIPPAYTQTDLPFNAPTYGNPGLSSNAADAISDYLGILYGTFSNTSDSFMIITDLFENTIIDGGEYYTGYNFSVIMDIDSSLSVDDVRDQTFTDLGRLIDQDPPFDEGIDVYASSLPDTALAILSVSSDSAEEIAAFYGWSPSGSVPLPATMWLFVTGLLGLASVTQRRRGAVGRQG